MSIFYDHIILIHHVHSEIESMPVEVEHKHKLVKLVEETVHHRILHRILDHLPGEHHNDFMDKFHQSPDDEELLEYLKNHIPDIEHHIKEAADDVKYELLKTIRNPD